MRTSGAILRRYKIFRNDEGNNLFPAMSYVMVQPPLKCHEGSPSRRGYLNHLGYRPTILIECREAKIICGNFDVFNHA